MRAGDVNICFFFFKKQQHLPAQVPAVFGNEQENLFWRKEISLTRPPLSPGEQSAIDRAGSVFSSGTEQPYPASIPCFPFHLSSPFQPSFCQLLASVSYSVCSFFLEDPNLLVSHHSVVCGGAFRGHARPRILSHQLLL